MDVSFSRRPPGTLRQSRSVWNFGNTLKSGGISKTGSPSSSPARRLRTSHSNLERLNASRGSSLSRHRSYNNLSSVATHTFSDLLSRSRYSSTLSRASSEAPSSILESRTSTLTNESISESQAEADLANTVTSSSNPRSPLVLKRKRYGSPDLLVSKPRIVISDNDKDDVFASSTDTLSGLSGNTAKRPKFDVTVRQVQNLDTLPPGRSARPGYFSVTVPETEESESLPKKEEPPSLLKSNFTLGLSLTLTRKSRFAKRPQKPIMTLSRPKVEDEDIKKRRQELLEYRKRESERQARLREEERQRLAKLREDQERERLRQDQLRLENERRRQQEEEERRKAEEKIRVAEEMKKAEEAKKLAKEEEARKKKEELQKATASPIPESKPMTGLFSNSSTTVEEKTTSSTDLSSKPTSFNFSSSKPSGDNKPGFSFTGSAASTNPGTPKTEPASIFGFNSKPASGSTTPKPEPASIFGFNSKPASRSTTPVPATNGTTTPSTGFSFNFTKPSTTTAPATSSTTAPSASTGFSFGSSSSTNPASIFKFGGTGNTSTQPTSASTNSTTPAKPSFNFSAANPSTSFNFASEGSNPASIFNFGSSQPKPAVNSPAPNFGAPQQDSSSKPFSFNFGGAAANPASATPATPATGMFGQSSTPQTNQGQAPPPGRKLAPMRRRIKR